MGDVVQKKIASATEAQGVNHNTYVAGREAARLERWRANFHSIPFVGAWIELKQLPHTAESKAYIGLGGRLLGTVGALGAYFLARETNATWLLAAAYSGFFLNLFNRIPLPPFNGGCITAVLSPRVWLFRVPVTVALFLWKPSPMLVLMAMLAAPSAWKAIKYRKTTGPQDHKPTGHRHLAGPLSAVKLPLNACRGHSQPPCQQDVAGAAH